jgi:HEAT repeat protein
VIEKAVRMFESSRARDYVKAISNGKEEARAEAVRSLKALSTKEWLSAPADVVKPLVEALRHQLSGKDGPNGNKLPTHVRRDAAYVLGKMGTRATSSVPQLIELLKESEPLALRESAVTALGDIGEPARNAVTPLLAMLTPECRIPLAVRVARALGEIGAGDAKVRTALVDLWRSTAAASLTQIEIGLALCKLRCDPPGLVTGLANVAVAATNVPLRTAAVEALSWCSKTQVGVVPALTAASQDEDENIKALGVAGLERLGVTAPKAIQICARQLKDCPPAETALRRVGAPSVSVLTKALEEEEPIVREKAAKILGSIGEAAASARDALKKSLTDKCSEVRLAGAKALWNITKQPEAVVPALAGLLTGKIWPAPSDSEVRRRFLQSVIEALGRIGPPAQAAIPSLLARSKDENRLVRESAVCSLRQIDPVAVAKTGA